MLTQRFGSDADEKYVDSMLKIIKENPGCTVELAIKMALKRL